MSETPVTYEAKKPEMLPENGICAGTSYPIEGPVEKDLENRFVYHAPINDQQMRYAAIRAELLLSAKRITAMTPKSREQSLALTKLEEAMYWANAAIARNEPMKSFTGASH